MVFSSNAFLFVFLPLFLSVYYLTPNRRRYRNYVILGGSYAFYGWWRLDFLFLFAAVTAFNYIVGGRIGAHGARTVPARRWMRFGVTINLAVLGYFKYTNFGVATFNDLLTSLGQQPVALTHVILPIGISFYIFESISYVIDVYRGSVKATKHPVDFATFIALFPHLIVGPIFRYKDLANQFEHREHSLDLFGRGAVRFMQGFAKKVIVADTLAPLVNYGFGLPDPSTADAWLSVLAFGVQLYFDFSGYSDMAVGLGLMMGFRFVENFNHPFLSQSITEFWRRWHISLTNWLRDYVFYSLGGSGRKTKTRIHLMVFATFLIGGIWHGANWTFICWGALQGFLLFIERVIGVNGYPGNFKWWRWIPTFFGSIALGMVLFRSDTLAHAGVMYLPMFFIRHVDGISDPFAGAVTRMEIATLVLAYVYVAFEGLREYGPKITLGTERQRVFASMAVLVPLFVLAISKLSAQGYSAFLYFQF